MLKTPGPPMPCLACTQAMPHAVLNVMQPHHAQPWLVCTRHAKCHAATSCTNHPRSLLWFSVCGRIWRKRPGASRRNQADADRPPHWADAAKKSMQPRRRPTRRTRCADAAKSRCSQEAAQPRMVQRFVSITEQHASGKVRRHRCRGRFDSHRCTIRPSGSVARCKCMFNRYCSG